MNVSVRGLFASPRRQHFMRRLKQAQMAVWDLEFQKDRMEQLREEMRQQYDKVKERHAVNVAQLEAEKEKGKAGDQKLIEHLQNMTAKTEPDLKAMENQLGGLDEQIHGDGGQSLTDQLEALNAARDMLRWYLKHRV